MSMAADDETHPVVVLVIHLSGRLLKPLKPYPCRNILLLVVQGVPIAKRFALVPLGPPLMAYSSTSKNMITYDEENRAVRLVVSGPVEAGRPVAAWCGPQPNNRLLLNYGIVDEHNPFDKLQFTFTLPTSDPLFTAKRAVLTDAGLATQQNFDVSASRPLPPLLLPYMMVALAATPEQVASVSFAENAAPGHDRELEEAALAALMSYVQRRTAAYAHPLWRDLEANTIHWVVGEWVYCRTTRLFQHNRFCSLWVELHLSPAEDVTTVVAFVRLASTSKSYNEQNSNISIIMVPLGPPLRVCCMLGPYIHMYVYTS
ncbi:hypothetical protein Vafri_17382 [Volvox africanus]|uniref:Rubisco LSMT substrate-binding domain-containing protein n=1 Tax=Volvox africanus TaxID=51714 RepID=A0A8J4BJY9_9CHLO|nr:hypothetical protein Vafri_17382 [Volvox africanus]